MEYYEEITRNPDTAGFYYAWRDQAIAHYFLGNDEPVLFSIDVALSFENARIYDSKNYRFITTLSDCLITGDDTTTAACFAASPSMLRAKLQENEIFQSSFIVHNKTETFDPFFEVEHAAFYQ